MIRSYLRDLINNHKPTMESNNEENARPEWKIQLVMQNNFFLIKILKTLEPYIQQVNLSKFIWVVTQKMLLIHFLIQF